MGDARLLHGEAQLLQSAVRVGDDPSGEFQAVYGPVGDVFRKYMRMKIKDHNQAASSVCMGEEPSGFRPALSLGQYLL